MRRCVSVITTALDVRRATTASRSRSIVIERASASAWSRARTDWDAIQASASVSRMPTQQQGKRGQLPDRLLERRGAAGVQGEVLAVDLEVQLLAEGRGCGEPGLGGRGQTTSALDGVDPGDPVLETGLVLSGEQLERDHVFGRTGDAGQHVANDQRCVQHTEQPRLPLRRVAGNTPPA